MFWAMAVMAVAAVAIVCGVIPAMMAIAGGAALNQVSQEGLYA